MTTIEALGDLKDDYTLHAHCNGDMCFHNASLSVPAMVVRFGQDFPIRELAGKLRCGKCGGKKIQTIMSPVKTGPS